MNYFGAASLLFKEEYPACAGGMLFSQSSEVVEELAGYAESILEYHDSITGGDQSRLKEGLEALAMMSFEFLRMQSRFRKTGRYQHSSAKENVAIYNDKDRMLNVYLSGLLLSYAFWPNHTRIYKAFSENFLSTIKSDGAVLEIGTGHGLMALTLLKRYKKSTYTGFDISQYSLEFASRFIAANLQDGSDRVNLQLSDSTDDNTWAQPPLRDGNFDAMICCEVLEHIENPKVLLENMHHVLNKDGKVFITTVANIEAEDHIFLFRSIEEIHALVKLVGFTIVEDFQLPLAGFENDELRPYNYAAVLSKM